MLPVRPHSPPITLAIDTGHARCGCAISDSSKSARSKSAGSKSAGSDHVTSLVVELERGHAEIIVSQIEALLAKAGLAYSDIGRLSTTTGPGSFTGLRVGLSVVKALGLALKVPVLGVPTLVALSLGGPEKQEFLVLVDARRDEFYLQRFSSPGIPANDIQIISRGHLTDEIGPEELVIGTGGEVAADLCGAIAIGGRFVDMAALAEFAAVADIARFPPAPLYIRGPDAKPQLAARLVRQ
ncbi:MAG: tRNA (adenosine(37)-N6)-threonylcarbamoyltransferase complex dimerization subunit type 1 TsaB [Alphaproteobacteria bacterium]|nr:tRNA (adenosine(37)-N6)-threonylcarbamoyltransferase complex dimerization subunit type 1 TsaB [Alphaproteobacteria bacterium]